MSRNLRATERLDRRLAHATGLSRSQAQRAIHAGEVCVDGQVINDPAQPVSHDARVEYAGTPLSGGFRYYMLHKPAGVVSATRDREHRTVLDLLEVPNRHRLHVAGRLDRDTTGLVLITDDGDWSHRITSPRHKQPKTYLAVLAEPLTPQSLERLRLGVHLRDETRPCAPAKVEIVDDRIARLTISEGKYHQVRRMVAAVGNHVQQLHREQIGPLRLDPELAAGEARALTDSEIGLFEPD